MSLGTRGSTETVRDKGDRGSDVANDRNPCKECQSRNVGSCYCFFYAGESLAMSDVFLQLLLQEQKSLPGAY